MKNFFSLVCDRRSNSEIFVSRICSKFFFLGGIDVIRFDFFFNIPFKDLRSCFSYRLVYEQFFGFSSKEKHIGLSFFDLDFLLYKLFLYGFKFRLLIIKCGSSTIRFRVVFRSGFVYDLSKSFSLDLMSNCSFLIFFFLSFFFRK